MWSFRMRRISFVVSALIAVSAWLPANLSLSQTQSVNEVSVEESDGVTRIVLRGGRDYVYTAFMREDPPRLIVELPDVIFDGVSSPIEVNNELVSRVTLGSLGDPSVSLSQARVSIELAQLAEYQLTPKGAELWIEIRPGTGTEGGQTASADEASTEVPAAFDIVDSQSAYATPKDANDSERSASSSSQPASTGGRTRLTGIRANGSEVRLSTQGARAEVDAFRLESPARVVVDLPGAKLGKVSPKQTVAEGAVERVRVAAHSDKVRVVVDLRDPNAAHRVDTTSDGVVVRLGDEDSLVAAAPDDSSAESVPVPGAKPSVKPEAERFSTPKLTAATDGSPARVVSTHFESLPGLDRVVVTLDHSVDAELVAPDPNTLIVRLPRARIDSSVERRVDTREFGGPVEIFSVFQTPELQADEVRVVLKRAPGIPGKLVWRDDQLHVELERPETAPFSAEAVSPGDSIALRGGPGSVPAAPGDGQIPSMVPVPGQPGSQALGADPFNDPFAFEGPADPASIDILEEGGFSEEKEYVGRRVSLDFKDADIGNILRLIAEVSDLNVIAGEEVSGTVTIRLVDVPWDQALDVILLTKGLGFVRVGNVLRIAPLETIKLEAEQRLQERRAKEKLEDLVVKLQPVNYANVDDVKALVKRLLSKRGSVDVDERTNTLIIKDIPSVVQEATALLKAIDTQTPQVLIEAKIVEANLSFSRSLGTVWGLGYTPQTSPSGNQDFGFGSTRDSLIGDDLQQNNFVSSTPGVGALNGLLNLGILSLDDRLQLDLQVQAAESNNKGKVISAPRVVTIDNREATIKQGVAIAFTEATADRITTSFIDAVLELTVTPHITADRSIIMDIKVSKNAPQLSASTGSVTGISKNEANTEALVKDGETIVLGGIYVVDSGRQNQKVPFLADIPLLGTAFRNSSVDDERRELLIFVTPRVILGRPSDV